VRIGLILDTHVVHGIPGLDELPPKVKEEIIHQNDNITDIIDCF
jgi:hypothetical protein